MAQNTTHSKVTGILVLVTGGPQKYLPVAHGGLPLAPVPMDAGGMAAWLCANELCFLTKAEFAQLGAALPPHIKGHIMIQLASSGCVSLEFSRWSFLNGQRILAEHRRFLSSNSVRLISI